MVEVVVVSNDALFALRMLNTELWRRSSVVSVVKFDLLHSDHLVSEDALFLGVKTSGRTEVSTGCTLVLGDALLSKVLSLVVGLVLVVFLQISGHAASLRQTPSGEVSLG